MPVGTITPIATVLHSTLTQSRKKLVLASMKSNALMAWAFANERVELEGACVFYLEGIARW